MCIRDRYWNTPAPAAQTHTWLQLSYTGILLHQQLRHRAYYARLEGFPSEKEDLVGGILADELRRSKNIARSYGKLSSPILKAPVHLQRLGMTLEARLRVVKRSAFRRNASTSEDDVGPLRNELQTNPVAALHRNPGPAAIPNLPLTDVITNVNPDRAHRKKRKHHLTLPRLAAALEQASLLPVLTTNP